MGCFLILGRNQGMRLIVQPHVTSVQEYQPPGSFSLNGRPLMLATI